MRLVKTTTLVFAEGRSDKLYEVDLCEVGPGQFVVNFRYGKRGTPLKDGSKTIAPVGQPEAERVYDKLVQQQLEKGYLPEGAPRPAPAAPPVPAPAVTAGTVASGSLASEQQRTRILERLTKAAATAATSSVRPPAAPSAPPPAPAGPAPAGVGGTIVSFSVQQGFGVVRLDSGQQLTFDAGVARLPYNGIFGGLRVRMDIGPARVPGQLAVRLLWQEGVARPGPLSQPPRAAQPSRRPVRKGASLERVIWRAGELRIREAEPALLALVGTAPASAGTEAGGKGLRDYCIAWALGRLGTTASMETLGRLHGDPNGLPHVKRIATLALQELGDDASRADFARHLAGSLPPPLREAAVAQGAAAAERFADALRVYLAEAGPDAWGVVDLLYAMNTDTVRPAILEQLALVPLKAPYFYFLRHVFKAAEYRKDGRVFGLCAYRFEKTRANFVGSNVSLAGARHLRAGQPMLAYGSLTRTYLRRRAWRTLRRTAEAGDALGYVKLAVGILLPFTDADAVEPRRSFVSQYDTWAPYWALNHVLFGRSARFEPTPNGKTFRIKRGSRLGAKPPATREEAYPDLWDARPEGLMHLFAESACTLVHEFAAKAAWANPAFLDQLDVEDVVMLLGRPFEVTAGLGFLIAEKRYDPRAADLSLLAAMARSIHEPARAKAFQWLDEQRARVLAEGALVAELVLSPFADTRAFARQLLRSSTFTAEAGSALVARIVATMMSLTGSEADAQARDATHTLTVALAAFLGTVGPEVVRDLLGHPLSGVQELGAELLLRADLRTGPVPDEILVQILHSVHANVRAVGMRILGELPDDVLARMEMLLVRLSTDKNGDLRSASRPLVQRVARAHPTTAETIARALVEALLRRKLPEGAPRHVLGLLREDLRATLTTLDSFDVWRLLQSDSPDAQELGGLLLQGTDPSRLTVEQVVRLASHDILAVRQAAWTFYETAIGRVQAEIAEACRILDAKWEDSRAFAFKFFRERLGSEAFGADVLVTILDSVRPDVQAFGRELTTKYFRDEDGPALMAKLAEHPSVSVQLYTTNYLARFATDRPGALESLVPYLTTVLTRVNQGRVAKKRVLAFLESEGAKNEEAARVVVAILHRVSASMAVELRSSAVAAMVAIHHAQPGIVSPLRVKSPPLRGADGVRVRV